MSKFIRRIFKSLNRNHTRAIRRTKLRRMVVESLEARELLTANLSQDTPVAGILGADPAKVGEAVNINYLSSGESSWVAVGNSGDVFVVDIAAMFPGQSYELVDVKVVSSTTESSLTLTTNPLRGDVSLNQGTASGPSAGYLLFPDRMEMAGKSFSESGRFYFAPGTASNIVGDTAMSDRAFQGTLVFIVKVDGVERRAPILITPSFNGAGALAVTDGATPLEVARTQQRLRYLGFVEGSAQPIVVDGLRGALTQRAISLFNAAITGSDLTNDNKLTTAAIKIINASNAPTWGAMASAIVASDFTVSVPNQTVITGTSWATELFRNGVRASRAAGLPSSTPVAKQLSRP